MARGYSSRSQAFSFDIDFQGLDEALKQLPKTYSRTVLRNALKKAGKPIQEVAKANAPVDEGDLQKSIMISTKVRGRRVRAKTGAIVFVGSTAPHAHLVEFGTVERFKKSKNAFSRAYNTGGASTGKMPANPFFTHAWDRTKKIAYNILKVELWSELERASKRLAKRAAKGTLSKSAIEFLGK